jgi:predicted nucleic acid-binding Zn ribbon protein
VPDDTSPGYQPESSSELPSGVRGPDLARAALARAKEDARARVAAAQRTSARRGPQRRAAPERGERGPVALGVLLGEVVEEQGWSAQASTAGVIARWPELVGADIADHCTPAGLRDGTLHLVAESTAWATQLRLLQRQILARLRAGLGESGQDVVRRITVAGPTAPDWGHGRLRSRDGRGPRDTYG